MKRNIFIAVLLIIAVASVFWQVVEYDFIRFDEEQYVTKNRMVQTGLTWAGVRWAFTATEAGFWQPLVWLSHMLDCEIYGLNPAGHHLTSLLIHLLNVLLLFLVMKAMTGSPGKSAFLAFLFALHPLNVEPVAWIADRKDLLCAFFWFLTMGAYWLYVRKPSKRRYLVVLAVFSLGLMTKPMIVTLPLILLILDYWPLSRLRYETAGVATGSHGKEAEDQSVIVKRTWQEALLEKLPFLLLTLPIVALTFLAETQAEALPSHEAFPLSLRLANVLMNYVQYLIKAIYPLQLAVFYPQPGWRPLWQPVLAGLAIALITITAMRMSKQRPWLVTGWLWYLVALLPVSGLVQIGSHVMADRYTYLPLIGIFIIVSWGGSELLDGAGGTRRAVLAAVVTIMSLSFLSSKQAQTWQNTETLFLHALTVTERNYLAHNNLGVVLLEKGKAGEGAVHFQEAVKINPRFQTGRVNLGNALITMGRMEEGIACYREVLKIDPDNRLAMRNLADALVKKKEYGDAVQLYKKIYLRNAGDPELNNNFGVALIMAGRREEGIIYLRRAVSLAPEYLGAVENLKRIETRTK